MQKIMLIGSGGAGKSTLAKRISQKTNIPIIHLDCEYFLPGWEKKMNKEDWKVYLSQLVEQKSWIIDGNYTSSLDVRLEAADMVIFLKISKYVCVWRLFKRWINHRGSTRPDVADGCEEKFSWNMVKWIWGFPHKEAKEIEAVLEKYEGKKRIVRIHTQKEVESFLAGL